MDGSVKETKKFIKYLSTIQCKYIIVHPGRFDTTASIDLLKTVKNVVVLNNATTTCDGIRVCSASPNRPPYTVDDIVITDATSDFNYAMAFIEHPPKFCIINGGDYGIESSPTTSTMIVKPAIIDSGLVHQPIMFVA
jgi:hypothetical protein